MSKTYLQGAIIITIASLLSKIIGSVFRIPLQNIAGNEVFGIFTIVYPVYMTVLTLSVAGIPLAISKLISEARVKNDQASVRNIFVTASILGVLFGISSFAIIALFSQPISSLLGGEYARLSLLIVSTTLLVAPYMAVYRGYFQGFEDMKPTAISQVLEQLVRVGILLLVAYFLVSQGYAAHIVAGGVMIGSIFGAMSSLIYLRSKYQHSSDIKPVALEKYSFTLFKGWSKKILLLSLPICIGALTMALINVIDSITVPRQLAAIGFEALEIPGIYNYYGRGQALVQIAVVFAQALTLPLIPLISSSLVTKDVKRTTKIIEQGLAFTHLTAWPAAIGLFVLTIPLNFALFGDFQENGVIAVVHISALFTAIAVLTTGILQGMNRTISSALLVVTVSIVKVILNILFIHQFGLIGVAYSTLIVYILLACFNIWLMRKTISFSIWKREYSVFAISAVVMGVVIAIPTIWLQVETWPRLYAIGYVLFMIIVGAMIYGVLVLRFKGLSNDELRKIPLIGGKLIKISS
ncbi:oligosaccharide flippase family protein [Evansella sp. AB-rgal1]|uniref:putative polysaccharide biosynthesis protein n=1 Tax=Evansella sp. AB-rgal1 TaxID=3242696 RepID=UPI00359F0047